MTNIKCEKADLQYLFLGGSCIIWTETVKGTNKYVGISNINHSH